MPQIDTYSHQYKGNALTFIKGFNAHLKTGQLPEVLKGVEGFKDIDHIASQFVSGASDG